MIGSIDHINTRIDDLVKAGLKYLVLGPVTDDPAQIDLLAKKVMTALQVGEPPPCDSASTCPPAAPPPRPRRSRPWSSAGSRSASPRW